MNRHFAVLGLLALTSVSAFSMSGCIIGDCDSGEENCIQAETGTRYENSKQDKSAAYASGQGIRITSVNGSVDVRVGGDQVAVTFQPFAFDKSSEEGKNAARDEMDANLVLEVTEGDTIEVRAAKKDGANSSTGADIVVTIPSSFNGAFEVSQNNGSVEVDLGGTSPTSTKVFGDNGGVDVYNAAGDLDIVGENGSMNVSVASWSGDGEGKILCGNGDLVLSVPSGADGTMTLVADGDIIEGSIPGEWVKAENSGGASYTMGPGDGAHVDITTEFGDIELSGS